MDYGYSLRKNLLQFHIIAMHCCVHRLLDFVLLYEVEYFKCFWFAFICIRKFEIIFGETTLVEDTVNWIFTIYNESSDFASGIPINQKKSSHCGWRSCRGQSGVASNTIFHLWQHQSRKIYIGTVCKLFPFVQRA